MEETSRAPLFLPLQAVARAIDFQAVAIWLLGFLMVVYLGVEGGGYDPIVHDQVGIAVWWGILLGLAVGALPVRRLPYGAWVGVGALVAYVAWVALSASWSSTVDRSFEDLARVATYLGIFVLAISIRGPRALRRMVSAVGSGIFVVATVALLSRLHPAWFPNAGETLRLLPVDRSRLAYPVGYWNGLAALVAIGLPLLLHQASTARYIVTQAFAAAALPAMALVVYLTFSRGGLAAAVVAVVVFFAFAQDRTAKAMTAVIAIPGAAILIGATHQRAALDNGLSNHLAQHQGNEILAMTIVVCAGVGLLQAGLVLWLRNGQRPAWTVPSRRTSRGLLAVVGAVIAIGVVGLLAGGKFSHAWHEFKDGGGPAAGSGRLQSFSSNGRVPYWESALEEFRAHPVVGGGSGSFEVWWAKHGKSEGAFVQDAHSLYIEALGELGVVGFAILVFFFGWIIYIGLLTYFRASRSRRTQLAAAMAGMAAFIVSVAYDWFWEVPVISISFLLLAAMVISAGGRTRRRSLPLLLRLGGCAVAVAAMVAIAIPLASTTSIEESQAAVRSGDLDHALDTAQDAVGVEPFAAAPHLQEALVLEAQGNLGPAEAAAQSAVHREPQEWRAWVVLSRLQAKSGKVDSAVASYKMAKSLNPGSPLFR